MARISTYPKDTNISLTDKLIGTDADNSSTTKNFEISDLINFFEANGESTELIWRGPWVFGSSYVPNDAVEYNGSSYICVVGEVNSVFPPPANQSRWDLLAAKGNTGYQGPQGIQGLIWRGIWNNDSEYDPGDAVEYNGSSYICVVQTTLIPPPNNPSDWDLLAQEGAEGQSILWAGTWADDIEYDVGNSVQYNGSSYICVVPTTGFPVPSQDPANWDLLAQEGDDGLGYNLTSTTKNFITIGSKTFVVNLPIAESAYRVGSRVRAIFNSSNYMEGVVTLYTNNTLILNVDYVLGFGQRFPWTFSIAGLQNGPQGPEGIEGPPGPPGPVGPAGLEWQGSWTSGASYIEDDAVAFGGASYFCIQNTSGTTSPPDDPSNWALLASQGAIGPVGPQGPTGPQGSTGDKGDQGLTGAQGIQGPTGAQGIQGTAGLAGPVGPAGLNWESSWVSGTSYVEDDAVAFGGASYFCILATSGTTAPNVDTTHWALLASQGAQGPAGAQGPTGPQGPQGESSNSLTLQQVVDNGNTVSNGVSSTTIAEGFISITDLFGSLDLGSSINFYRDPYTVTLIPSNTLTGTRIIQLPDANGTIALTNDITLQNAIDGGNTITDGVTTMTVTANSIKTNDFLGGQIEMVSDSISNPYIKFGLPASAGKTVTLTHADTQSASRTIKLPDANGTIALTSQLPTVSGNYIDDPAAAAGGILVGGLYHTAGVVKIRLV